MRILSSIRIISVNFLSNINGQILDTDRNEDFQFAQSAVQLCAYAHIDISNLRRQQ